MAAANLSKYRFMAALHATMCILQRGEDEVFATLEAAASNSNRGSAHPTASATPPAPSDAMLLNDASKAQQAGKEPFDLWPIVSTLDLESIRTLEETFEVGVDPPLGVGILLSKILLSEHAMDVMQCKLDGDAVDPTKDLFEIEKVHLTIFNMSVFHYTWVLLFYLFPQINHTGCL